MDKVELPESPRLMGFTKFDQWRVYQKEICESVINSNRKVFMLDAPTGSGKSLIAMVVGKQFPRMVYTCTTKTLQDQLTSTFPEVPILKGRSNYPCLINSETEAMFPDVTADDCPSGDTIGGMKKSCMKRCPYMIAKIIALGAQTCIINTSYLLSESNFVGRFSDIPFITIDEADELEGELMKFVEISVTSRILEKIHLNPPQYKTKSESWKQWAVENLPGILNMINGLKRKIEDPIKDRYTARLLKSLQGLAWKMKQFETNVDDHWIYEETEKKWTWKPIWINKYAEGYLWKHANRFLLMSATILSPVRLGNNLGIKYEDREYKAIPSQFPPERRKVIYSPVADLTRKTREMEIHKIIPAIGNIIRANPKSKGLIHTVSYDNANYVMSNVNSGRLITHNSKDREKVLHDFTSSSYPFVLVSPSMDRGVDFKYDLLRWIIILKLPWPDLSDKQTKARVYSSSEGQQWYAWMTACTIVQMTGRGMRAEDDWCTSYVIDKQFEKFYSNNGNLFPAWWRESLVIGDDKNEKDKNDPWI